MIKIAVIVPFYQRESGILRKAIISALAQAGPFEIDILIVDDESPIAPDDDIDIQLPKNCTISVFSQKNSGPGGARNLGLGQVSTDSVFIAFLDSDDRWDVEHLSRAIHALGEDRDFYFANHVEPEAKIDTFTLTQRPKLADHKLLLGENNCYQYTGDMINQIITDNIIETSTVVFRRSSLGHLRFRSEFRNAFEDHLFWLSVAEATNKIAFSSCVDSFYGKGINIYRSVQLGSERLISQLIDQTRFRRELLKKYGKTREQMQKISQLAAETRTSLIAEILHRLKRRMRIEWKLIFRLLALDPALIIASLPILYRILIKKNSGL